MQGAMTSLGIEEGWLEVQILQHVTFLEGGQPIKMSKRAGSFVTMDALIDEVGADVTKYIFLTRKPNSHLDFDLDLAKDQTEKNPVLKIKYAHARICSLLSEAAARGIDVGEPDAADAGASRARGRVGAHGGTRSACRASSSRRHGPRAAPAGGVYADEIAALYNEFYHEVPADPRAARGSATARSST
jgi:arginyl-tRNA synthetase